MVRTRLQLEIYNQVRSRLSIKELVVEITSQQGGLLFIPIEIGKEGEHLSSQRRR